MELIDYENTQEIDNVLNFINKHINNNGSTFSPEFQLIDMTEYCPNYNNFNQLFFIVSSISGEMYFYTTELGLIEFEVINGKKFIPKFLKIGGVELNKALDKLRELVDVINVVIMNPPNEDDEMESFIVGDKSIQCMSIKKYVNQRYETSFSVKSHSDYSVRKHYIVDTFFDKYTEYKIIRE